MKDTRLRGFLMMLVLLALPATAARAFINAHFTPVDLVRQSDTILLLEFGKADAEGVSQASVKKVLKGKFTARSVTVDFQAGAYEDQGKTMTDAVGKGGREGILFVGSFDQPGQAGEPAPGYLDLGGKWVSLTSEDDEAWDMVRIDRRMLGTWAGSTDMLVRAVTYVQDDPDAVFRVSEGTTWDKPIHAVDLSGKTASSCAVDLAGDGKLTLYLGSSKGDRLFQWDGKRYQDVTTKHKLVATSQASAWGDFNADGKPDLASWDGRSVQLHMQQPDGTFQAQALDVGVALENGCLGLSTTACEVPGCTTLVVSTRGAPVLLTPTEAGGWKASALAGKPPGELGDAGRCVAADLDGDAVPDVLQLFSAGSLFYKGKAPGRFAGPVRTAIRMGASDGEASLGDFDGDGMLDILVTSETANGFWQNRGSGRFEESMAWCGEVGYIAKAGACGSLVGDFNNDGLQDFVILYANRLPHLFFNRGFRCFGHARAMDPEITEALPRTDVGEQAGTLADLDGDGALDMALVLDGGQLWIFHRAVDKPPALSLSVALSASSKYRGPVNVTASRDERDLGTWVVRPGGPPVLVGTETPGPTVVRWRVPGGGEQKKETLIVDKPVRLVLEVK